LLLEKRIFTKEELVENGEGGGQGDDGREEHCIRMS
jgi:hypothetical protein